MGQKKVNELKVGSIITYINLIISTIIPLLYTPIMLRILGQEEYGLYSLSNSVISYLTLLNLGFGTAIIRFISKFRIEGDHDKIEGVTGLILSIYGIIAIIVCIVGFLLTKGTGLFFGTGLTVNEIQRLKILMVIMTVSTAISFPVSVLSSVSVAYEKYIFRKMVDMIATIATPMPSAMRISSSLVKPIIRTSLTVSISGWLEANFILATSTISPRSASKPTADLTSESAPFLPVYGHGKQPCPPHFVHKCRQR